MPANTRCRSFLVSVLGKDGARAILKAADHSSGLKGAVVPRAIQAWLGSVKVEYSGEIPGVETSQIRFTKSEGLFTGHIAIGDEVFKLQKSTASQTLAAVAVALDLDKDIGAPSVRDIDLERLGKSLDVLVKARALNKEIEKEKEELEKEELEKATEAPGPSAAPIPPKSPIPPEPTQPKVAPETPPTPKAKTARAPKPVSSVLRVTKAEADNCCPLCGGVQFRNETFTGCLCFRDLAKTAKVVTWGPQITLNLGEDWDQDAISTLLSTLGR